MYSLFKLTLHDYHRIRSPQREGLELRRAVCGRGTAVVTCSDMVRLKFITTTKAHPKVGWAFVE
ncbi:hypothetical protein [Sanguibacter keddieii]|uniref:hypothetical protein n=1 Tax=Sanguibacter keddieii TaxID=60920 RepID=UPI0005A8D82B|nr:hypothetical protein [Sanguibacter keddieii]